MIAVSNRTWNMREAPGGMPKADDVNIVHYAERGK